MPKGQSLFKRMRPRPSRAEILELYDAGHSTADVARMLQISPAWARRVKQERAEQGKTANATTRRRVPLWAKDADRIKAAIAAEPDLTLSELKARLNTTLGRATLCRALKKLRLTLKKKS